MIHNLKIYDWALEELVAGRKTYEIRKDDQKYKVGDTLVFPYAVGSSGDIELRMFTVTHILTWRTFPGGLKRGYVILSLEPVPISE